MSGDPMKAPTIVKTINLTGNSALGQRVSVNIGNVHGLTWRTFYTVLNTAKGEFELKCLEKSLSPWKFLANVEVTFKGERVEEQIIEKEFLFSDKTTEMKLEPIEEGRKYNKIELKITRKEAVGVPQTNFVNFNKKNKWLDVLIRDETSVFKLYANSGVLALNSPVLRDQFEKSEGSQLEVVIPKGSFSGMKQLLNFLHPPYICKEGSFEIDTIVALGFAQQWEMSAALKAWEDMLCTNRRFDTEGHAKSLHYADKFKFRKLLEEVVYDLCPEDAYALLKAHTFSNWIRAAIFDGLMLEADNGTTSDESSETSDIMAFEQDIFNVILLA